MFLNRSNVRSQKEWAERSNQHKVEINKLEKKLIYPKLIFFGEKKEQWFAYLKKRKYRLIKLEMRQEI